MNPIHYCSEIERLTSRQKLFAVTGAISWGVLQSLALNPTIDENHDLTDYEIFFVKFFIGLLGLGIFSYSAITIGEYLNDQLNTTHLSDRLDDLLSSVQNQSPEDDDIEQPSEDEPEPDTNSHYSPT